MSFIRPGSKKLFSNSDDDALYVFKGKDYIEDYGGLSNPENLCEVMFRILDQADVEVDLEMVNKARDRIGLEPLDEIGDEYGKTQEFKEAVGELEDE